MQCLQHTPRSSEAELTDLLVSSLRLLSRQGKQASERMHRETREDTNWRYITPTIALVIEIALSTDLGMEILIGVLD